MGETDQADAPPPQPPRKRRGRGCLRWALKWAAVSIAFVVVTVFVLALCLPAITDTALVKGKVAASISSALNGADVRIDTLRVGVPGERLLRLEGLAVAPPGRPDEPIVTVGSLECRWRPVELLRGTAHVTGLTADSVRVNVRREDGAWNFEGIVQLSDEPLRLEDLRLPVAVRVEGIRVSDVALGVTMDGGTAASVEGLSLEGTCSLTDQVEGDVHISLAATGVRATTPAGGLSLPDGLEAQLSLARQGMSAGLSGSLAAGAVRVAVPGLGEFGPLPVQAGCSVQIDLDRMEAPRVGALFSIPPLLSDEASLSLTRDEGWKLAGRNDFTLDLEHLLRLVAHLQPQSVRSLEVAGRLEAGTDLAVAVSTEPMTFAGTAHTEALVTDLSAAAEVALADGASADAALTGGRVALTQNLIAGGPGDLRVSADNELLVAADSLRGAVAGLADVQAVGLQLGATCKGSLSELPAAGVEGSVAAEWVAVQSPHFGIVDLPVAVAFDGDLRGGLTAGPGLHGGLALTGSLGQVVPEMAAAIRFFPDGHAALESGATVDFSSLVELVPGLNDRLRDLIGTINGKGTAKMTLQATAGPPVGRAGVAAAVEFETDLTGLEFAREAVSGNVGELRSAGSVSLELGPEFVPRDLSVELRGEVVSADAGPASVERIDFTCGASAPDLTGLACTMSGSIGGLTVRPDGEADALFPPMDAKAIVDAKPWAGDLTIRDVSVELPDVLSLSAPMLSVRGFGEGAVAGDVTATVADIGVIVERAAMLLPEEVAALLPEVSGEAGLAMTVNGRAPLLRRIVDALRAGVELPAVELFPLSAFFERDLPLDVDVSFWAGDISVAHEVRPGLAVRVSGIDAAGGLALLDGQMTGDLDVSAPTVQFATSPVPLDDLRLDVEFALRDFDALDVNRFVLKGPGDLLDVTARVKATGLSRFQAVPRPGDLLDGLDVILEAAATVRPAGLGLVEDLDARGEMACDLSVELERGRRLAVSVHPRLGDVSVSYGNLVAVEGLSGRIGFDKEWQVRRAAGAGGAMLSRDVIARSRPRPATGARMALPEFATAADQLLALDDMIRVDSVSVFGAEVLRDAGVEAALRGSTLDVPRFYVHPLGGRLVGAASFARTDEGREAHVAGEFADVDFRGLLPPDMRDFPGDSAVNGTFSLNSTLSAEDAGAPSYNPVKDVMARTDITHVGAAALNRLLLSMDPTGENPSIVAARKALLLATPVRATASLERGFLGMNVELQGLVSALITQYPIPRFNVAHAYRGAAARALFNRAAPVMAALDWLDADVIELGEDGTIRPR